MIPWHGQHARLPCRWEQAAGSDPAGWRRGAARFPDGRTSQDLERAPPAQVPWPPAASPPPPACGGSPKVSSTPVGPGLGDQPPATAARFNPGASIGWLFPPADQVGAGRALQPARLIHGLGAEGDPGLPGASRQPAAGKRPGSGTRRLAGGWLGRSGLLLARRFRRGRPALAPWLAARKRGSQQRKLGALAAAAGPAPGAGRDQK